MTSRIDASSGRSVSTGLTGVDPKSARVSISQRRSTASASGPPSFSRREFAVHRRCRRRHETEDQARPRQAAAQAPFPLHQPPLRPAPAALDGGVVEAAAVDGADGLGRVPVGDDDRAARRGAPDPPQERAPVVGEQRHPENIEQRVACPVAALRLLVGAWPLAREQGARQGHQQQRDEAERRGRRLAGMHPTDVEMLAEALGQRAAQRRLARCLRPDNRRSPCRPTASSGRGGGGRVPAPLQPRASSARRGSRCGQACATAPAGGRSRARRRSARAAPAAPRSRRGSARTGLHPPPESSCGRRPRQRRDPPGPRARRVPPGSRRSRG